MYQPLADQLRPKSLDEVAGQRHILGEGGVLRRIIQGGTIPNLIFYGPSGTGKTTVAEIAAARIHHKVFIPVPEGETGVIAMGCLGISCSKHI